VVYSSLHVVEPQSKGTAVLIRVNLSKNAYRTGILPHTPVRSSRATALRGFPPLWQVADTVGESVTNA
jgi:hypothetical protein